MPIVERYVAGRQELQSPQADRAVNPSRSGSILKPPNRSVIPSSHGNPRTGIHSVSHCGTHQMITTIV